MWSHRAGIWEPNMVAKICSSQDAFLKEKAVSIYSISSRITRKAILVLTRYQLLVSLQCVTLAGHLFFSLFCWQTIGKWVAKGCAYNISNVIQSTSSKRSKYISQVSQETSSVPLQEKLTVTKKTNPQIWHNSIRLKPQGMCVLFTYRWESDLGSCSTTLKRIEYDAFLSRKLWEVKGTHKHHLHFHWSYCSYYMIKWVAGAEGG